MEQETRKYPHILLTDGNYLMMRSNYAFRNLSRKDGQPSGAVYGYIHFMIQYLNKYKPDYFIPAFDNGRSSFRTTISSDYKGNRGPKNDELVVQMKACREFLRLSGWTPYVERNTEADDLAAKVAKDCSKDYFVMLLSKDHDWQQLTKKNVVFVRPESKSRDNEIISYEKACSDCDFPVERWPEIAAIMGDPGDNVIGLKGWGWGKSLKVIKKYGDLWTAINSDDRLRPYASTILKNYELTKLDGTVAKSKIPLDDNKVDEVKDRIYENAEVIDFLAKWEMNSYIDRIEKHELWQW